MRDVIRRLARPTLRLLGRDDRGAVGVLVGVLLGAGVLLGMGALVIDVGRLYQERAELQNGADAGALAVAKTCALGGCATGTAVTYADANANRDGLSAVPLVCGRGSGLGGCPASTGVITDCPAAPGSGNYVDVHTSTLEAGGSTLLPPVLARALVGNGGYAGSTVGACARASWGAPTTANTTAFTISACEWDAATGVGTSFAPPPPYPPNPAKSFDRVLKLHTTSSGTCATEPAGADGPGAFGWTVDATGTCQVSVTDNTYKADTGVSAGSTCKDALAAAWAARTPVLIPIYVKITGTGANTTYTLKGFAAFVVTGYALPGFKKSDWLDPSKDCKGSDKCINGFFTHALVPGSGTTGGQNLGATIVSLTG